MLFHMYEVLFDGSVNNGIMLEVSVFTSRIYLYQTYPNFFLSINMSFYVCVKNPYLYLTETDKVIIFFLHLLKPSGTGYLIIYMTLKLHQYVCVKLADKILVACMLRVKILYHYIYL
jgi:hypothetical protein